MPLKRTILLGCLLLLVCGCATQPKPDPGQLSNAELLSSYYELTDELARRERSSASVGLGLGFGVRWLHVGLGLSKPLKTRNLADLRQQRLNVRLELERRGINP